MNPRLQSSILKNYGNCRIQIRDFFSDFFYPDKKNGGKITESNLTKVSVSIFMSSVKTNNLTSLLNKAREAQKKAVAPFSNFPVGVALETKSGKIYSGCNIEVSSYSLTICAERVAIFKAISEGDSQFTTIVVATDTNEFCPPCGACRQVLAEYAPDIKIVLVNSRGLTKHTSISKLLPEAFDKTFLENHKRDKT